MVFVWFGTQQENSNEMHHAAVKCACSGLLPVSTNKEKNKPTVTDILH